MEDEGYTISDVKNVKTSEKGWQRGVLGIKDTNHGGKRVQILAEYDYGTNPKKKLQKDAHDAK